MYTYMRYMCKYMQNTRMRITRIQFYDVPLKPNLPSLFCVKEEKESEKEEEKEKLKKKADAGATLCFV